MLALAVGLGACLREVQGEKVFEQYPAESSLQAHDQPDGLTERLRQVVVVGGETCELFGDAFLFAAFQFQQDVFLGREVEEEGPVGDAGRSYDRTHICGGDAGPLEFGHRSAHQALAGLESLGLSG